MGSKGTNTTTQNQTYTPNGAILGSGYQALGMAGNAAQQPFQNPIAPVAGFSGQQQQAFDQIGGMQGMAQPYFDQASALARQSAQPISADQIAHYYNPMAQNVFAAQNDLFGQQRTQNTGNLVQAAGGVGADRVAVGQSELARQQGLAQGQTAAGLYQSALGAAEQDPARQAQAAFALGSFGPAAQNANLQGSQALLGAGGLQQQLAQAQLNAPYQNTLQRLAYPFQTAQFLSGITGGLAPALGGTTNAQTTAPPPSLLSQILGGGLGAAGLYGAFGGFNSSPQSGQSGGGGAQLVGSAGNDIVDNAKGFAARGGAIAPFAAGGAPFGDDPFKDEGGTSIVPDMALAPGSGERPLLKAPQSAPTNSGPGVMDIAKMAMMFMQDGGAVEDGGADKYAAWRESNNIEDRRGETFDTMAPFTPAREPARPKLRRHVATGLAAEAGANDIWRAHHAAGGAVSPFAAGQGYGEGGDVIDIPPDDMPQEVTPGAQAAWRTGVDDDTAGGTTAQPTATTALNYGGDDTPKAPFAVRPGAPASPYADAPDAAMAQSGPGAITAGGERTRGQDFSRSPWMALAAAGLGMMGGTSPFAGVNIGQGGLQGLKALEAQRTAARQDRSVDLHAQQLAEQAAQHQRQLQQNLRIHQMPYEGMTAYQKAQLERENWAATSDQAGRPFFYNHRTGEVRTPEQVQEILRGRTNPARPGATPPPSDVPPVRTDGTRTAESDDESVLPKNATMTLGSDLGYIGDLANEDVKKRKSTRNEEFLATLTPEDARATKALVDYKRDLPSGMGMGKKREYLRDLATQYDSSYDEKNYKSQQAAQRDLTSGKTAGDIRSNNTLMGHLKDFTTAGLALDNTNLPGVAGYLNRPINEASRVGRELKQDPALRRFNLTADAVANEIERTFKGSPTTITGIREWRKNLHPAMTPEEVRTSARTVIGLVNSRMDAIKDQYNRAFNGTREGYEILSPNARKAYDDIMSKEAPEGAPIAAPAIPPAEQREVGKIYTNPHGKKGRWTGSGFEPVE